MGFLSKLVRTAGVLGAVVVATGTVGASSAVAGGGDELFARQPDRLLIESGQRVSDGRKLQKDADASLRRAEGDARGEAAGPVVAGQGDGSERTGTAAAEKASTGTSASR
jgi:hypothetical protein